MPRVGLIEVIAFLFSVFILYGCGAKPAPLRQDHAVLDIPVYVWQRRRAGQAEL